MTKIRDLIFTNGERYPILIQENGLPDYWITLYITEKLRPLLTQSAIHNTIDHLVHLKLWEKVNNRNLIKEFSDEIFLNDNDFYSIREHCLLDRKSLKKWLNSSNRYSVKFPSASTANIATIQTVSTAHAANRISNIASYLDFTIRVILKNKLINEKLSQRISEMNKGLLATKPKVTKSRRLSHDPNYRTPPPQAFEKILTVVKEDSPDNPFKNRDIRFRNAIIFEIMEATGMRAGEILALQISDIDFQKGTISVVRRHDAAEDPRKKQPVAKTNERTIPVKKLITDRVREYIMEVRAFVGGKANKHPYIFVTHKHGNFQGMPISNSTFVNRILKPAIFIHPELFENINRHGFRHNFNYKLSKSIDSINERAKNDPNIKPINEKKEIQIRKQLNGWSSDKSAEIYNLRHIREEANRVMLEDMNHWTKYINKG